jgi:hypothetical protein
MNCGTQLDQWPTGKSLLKLGVLVGDHTVLQNFRSVMARLHVMARYGQVEHPLCKLGVAQRVFSVCDTR